MPRRMNLFAKITLLTFTIAVFASAPSAATAANPIECRQLLGPAGQPRFLPSFRAEQGRMILKFTVMLTPDGSAEKVILHDTERFSLHAEFLKNSEPSMQGRSLAEIDELAFSASGSFIYGVLVKPPEGEPYFQLHTPERPQSDYLLNTVDMRIRYALALTFPNSGVRSLLRAPPARPQGRVQNRNLVIVPGSAAGKVVEVRESTYEAQLRRGEINENSIAVLNYIPKDFVPVAGMILSRPISDLTHLAMISSSLQIPIVSGSDMVSLALRHAGQEMHLHAERNQQPSLTNQMSAQMRRSFDLRNRRQALPDIRLSSYQGRLDLRQPHLLSAISSEDVLAFGPKSALLGHVQKLFPQEVLPGVALSLGFHDQLMNSPRASQRESLGSFVQEQLRKIDAPHVGMESTLQTLAEIRHEILNSRLHPNTVAEIQEFLKKHFSQNETLIVRSSSNAEDLPGFNGAGLHSSVDASISSLESALKEVLASLYSDRAYFARRLRGFRQQDVRMGFLIQPKLQSLAFNGVALYEREQKQLQVSYFAGNRTAVDTHGHLLPETLQIQWNDNHTIRGIPQNASALKREMETLVVASERIANSWPQSTDSQIRLDIEWGIELGPSGQQIFRIFQVRNAPASELQNSEHRNASPDEGSLLYMSVEGEYNGQMEFLLNQPLRIDWEIDTLASTVRLKNVRLHARNGDVVDLSGRSAQIRKVRAENSMFDPQVYRASFNFEWQGEESSLFLETYLEDDETRAELLSRFANTPLQISIRNHRHHRNTRYQPRQQILEEYRKPRNEGDVLPLRRIQIPNTAIVIEMGGYLEKIISGTRRGIPETLRVLGITTQPLVLDPLRAYVELPGHHNRFHSFAIDLRQTVENLSEEQLNQLETYGNFFLTFDSRSRQR